MMNDKLLTLHLAISIAAISPSLIRAQIITNTRAITRAEAIDSLQAGRKRWARAHVREYQIQSHMSCFCMYTLEEIHNQTPLLTVRNRAIVARAKGKSNTEPSRPLTVEGLFAKVEEDARTTGRFIEALDLHPAYGFPLVYKARASDPQMPDLWVQFRVDSFAVIKKR